LTESLGRSLLTTSAGSNASKSGTVEAFHADLDCSNGSVKSISATADPYNWNIEVDLMDDDCTAAVTATPSEKFSGAPDFLHFGNTVLGRCPGINQSKWFGFFGQLNVSAPYNASHFRQTIIQSFNSTVLVCTPVHTLQEALVTTDPAGALLDVEVQRTLEKIVIPPWDLWSAFNTSDQSAAPTFLVGPYIREYNHAGFSYDAFFAILLATWSREPAQYLNYETLVQDSRRVYTTTASQIANRFLRVNSTRLASGSYRTTQLRVLLRDPALRIIES
jgi:hypothetical protein